MLEKIERNQGSKIVMYQLKLMKAQRDRLELELQDSTERHEADMLKVLEDNKNKERDLERERSKIKLLEKDLKLCEDSIIGIGMTRPPREEPELELKIKVEESELKRFKKDETHIIQKNEKNCF